MRTAVSSEPTWWHVQTERLGSVRCLIGDASDAAPVASPVPPSARGADTGAPARWVWLLHGREGSAEELGPVVSEIVAAAAAGLVPPCTVVAPDGPWSQRMSWWVDSAYVGDGSGPPPGAAVETGLLEEVLPVLEHRRDGGSRAASRMSNALPTVRRTVVGVSMGGSAALRWLLRPDRLFDSAVLLSPAVYRSAPPYTSSARTSGAFGAGREVFDPARFAAVAGWNGLLHAHPPGAQWRRVVTIVGDSELAQDGPDEWAGGRGDLTSRAAPYDLDLQAAQLHAALRRRPDVDTHLRVIGGGHDVGLWQASIVPALQLALDDCRARAPG